MGQYFSVLTKLRLKLPYYWNGICIFIISEVKHLSKLFCILPGKFHGRRSLVGYKSMGSLRVRHDWATSLSLFTFMRWEGNGNPLQCSCLENPRDRGAWWVAVHGVAQSRTRLKWLSSSSISVYNSLIYSHKLETIPNDPHHLNG